MDPIMVGDLVMLLRNVQHSDVLGMVPAYTLGCALKRNADSSWQVAIVGFGEMRIDRDHLRLYEEKSAMRYEEKRRIAARLAGEDNERTD